MQDIGIVGSRETEDRNRHGPYARGEPLIRGKPTDVFNTVISTKERSHARNGRFLSQSFLRNDNYKQTVISTKERSLSNEVVFDNMRFRIKFGMTVRGKPPFIGSANSKMREYINIPIRGKPLLIWCRCVLIRGKPVGWLHRESRVLTAKKSVGFFGVLSRTGIALPKKLEDGRKSQSQFSVRQSTERNLIAQGAALCNECNADFVAPRLDIVQGGAVAWGKNKTLLAGRNRLAHSEETEKNRSLSS